MNGPAGCSGCTPPCSISAFPPAGGSLMTNRRRPSCWPRPTCPPPGRWAVDAGMRQVERLTEEMLPLRRQIIAYRGPPARLQGVAVPLRDRGAAIGCYLGGARRLPPVHQFRRRRAPHRPGRDGVVLGRQTHPWTSSQTGTTSASMGPLQGRCLRQQGPPPPTTPTTASSANASTPTWR